MKSVFQEYYSLSDVELQSLWNTALIVFDTNVLLNFYRYSDRTIQDFLSLLRNLDERIWIPHQVAYEFHEERLTVINQQSNVYATSLSSLNLLKDEFSNKNRNPFLSEGLFNEFSEILTKVTAELHEKSTQYLLKIQKDEMLETISEIFEGRVGSPFTVEKNKDIYTQGNSRYAKRIPPGYEDAKKPEEKRFGDLVMWLQIIEKAKNESRSVIFVTDERKEDWWLLHSGKVIGPRPELRKEFVDSVGQLFYVYQPFKFLEYASKHFNTSIDTTTITEVKDLQPFIIDQTEVKSDLTISVALEKEKDGSNNANINGLAELLRVNGYDVEVETSADDNYKLFIPVPNIPDLTRRIKSKFLSQSSLYGLKVKEFNH